MRSNLVGCWVVAAAVCLGTVTNGTADGGSFTHGCATRDMQIMMMLEGSNVTAKERKDAVHAIIDARMLCFEGYVTDAFELYDRIAQRLASSLRLSCNLARSAHVGLPTGSYGKQARASGLDQSA